MEYSIDILSYIYCIVNLIPEEVLCARNQFPARRKKYKISNDEIEDKLSFVVPKTTDKYYVLVKGRQFPPETSSFIGIGFSAREFHDYGCECDFVPFGV